MTDPRLTPTDWTFLLYMDSPGDQQVGADKTLLELLAARADAWPGLRFVYEISEEDVRLRGQILPTQAEPLLRVPRTGSVTKAITSLVDWAGASFPSRYTALILRDHGAALTPAPELQRARGWLAPNGQAKQPSGALTERGIRTALARSQRGRVDVYAFDACSMSRVEFAYEVRDVTSYVVAAEHIIKVTDFPYDAAIQAATKNPAAGPLGVALAIADAKSELFAVTEVGWMDKLAKSLGGLGEYLLDQFASKSINAVKPIEELRDPIPSSGDVVDLGQLLAAIRGWRSDPDLEQLVAQVDKYVNRACLSNGRPAFGGHPAAGLGISFPRLNTMGSMLGYGGLELARKTAWGSFLFQYLQFVAFRYINAAK
jgi:hypothetical protein